MKIMEKRKHMLQCNRNVKKIEKNRQKLKQKLLKCLKSAENLLKYHHKRLKNTKINQNRKKKRENVAEN